MGKAKILIHRDSQDRIGIVINDFASGLLVTRLSMSFKEFAVAVTGMYTITDMPSVASAESAKLFGLKHCVNTSEVTNSE